MFVAQPPHQEQPQDPTTKPTAQQEEQAAAQELEAEFAEALAALEQHIYVKEGEYLEKTPHGNVARGWEGFLDTRGMTAKRRFDDRDRLFSYSSWTFTDKHPHLFVNTRDDDDPDNWCLALRRRHQQQHTAAVVPGGYGAVVQQQASSETRAQDQQKGTTGRKKRQKLNGGPS